MYQTKNFEYIKERFPKAINTAKQLSEYLDRIDVDLSKDLTEFELEKVFVSLVDDYLKYKLDPDSLSDLCEKLYVVSENFKGLKNSRISNSLIQIADLEVYLREDFGGVESILKTMINKYDEIK